MLGLIYCRFHHDLPDVTSMNFELFTLHSIMVLALLGTNLLYAWILCPAYMPQTIQTQKIHQSLHSTLKTLQKDVVFCWIPSHVGIHGNEVADKALKGRKINIPLPFTDLRPIVKQFTRKQWSDFLSLQPENKLHAVQPTLGCSALSCREEIVLRRLRIGHSFLTHR